jgi:hypothetical protein
MRAIGALIGIPAPYWCEKSAHAIQDSLPSDAQTWRLAGKSSPYRWAAELGMGFALSEINVRLGFRSASAGDWSERRSPLLFAEQHGERQGYTAG